MKDTNLASQSDRYYPAIRCQLKTLTSELIDDVVSAHAKSPAKNSSTKVSPVGAYHFFSWELVDPATLDGKDLPPNCVRASSRLRMVAPGSSTEEASYVEEAAESPGGECGERKTRLV